MIVTVDQKNLLQAAIIYSVSWKKSHSSFCAPDFVEKHTPERQQGYIQSKIDCGSKFFMLIEDDEPIGIVSVIYFHKNREWVLAQSCCYSQWNSVQTTPLYGYSKTIPMQNGCIKKWDFKKQAE